MEPELRCSACEAVAAELQRRLDTELPRDKLDMRNRLDAQGQRYGRVLDYKVSEIRAVELLEDLCDAMSDYTLSSSSSPAPAAADTPPAAAASSEGGGAADSAADAPQGSEQPAARVWVKHRGEGSVHVPKGARPPKGEEEARAKQLKTFCGLLIENDEESVVEALMTDQFAAAGVAPVLCQEITKRCPAVAAS